VVVGVIGAKAFGGADGMATSRSDPEATEAVSDASASAGALMTVK
jgi:hypothetical protein